MFCCCCVIESDGVVAQRLFSAAHVGGRGGRVAARRPQLTAQLLEGGIAGGCSGGGGWRQEGQLGVQRSVGCGAASVLVLVFSEAAVERGGGIGRQVARGVAGGTGEQRRCVREVRELIVSEGRGVSELTEQPIPVMCSPRGERVGPGGEAHTMDGAHGGCGWLRVEEGGVGAAETDVAPVSAQRKVAKRNTLPCGVEQVRLRGEDELVQVLPRKHRRTDLRGAPKENSISCGGGAASSCLCCCAGPRLGEGAGELKLRRGDAEHGGREARVGRPQPLPCQKFALCEAARDSRQLCDPRRHRLGLVGADGGAEKQSVV
ncbi:hypothetical protein NESM_000422300 [Novymonas esmeraldas]|uniref:Uncharacterized protein n=1 Tax=Novymonas esmeraldas TaxID=1808958 RepID=A0AAW0EP68_9TRYP